MVQWLGIRVFTAEGPGSIPGQGTKIPKAVQHSQGKKEEREERAQGLLWPHCLSFLFILASHSVPLSLGSRQGGGPPPIIRQHQCSRVYLSNAISSHPSPSSTPQTFLHPTSAQTSTARPRASSLSGTASLLNGSVTSLVGFIT